MKLGDTVSTGKVEGVIVKINYPVDEDYFYSPMSYDIRLKDGSIKLVYPEEIK